MIDDTAFDWPGECSLPDANATEQEIREAIEEAEELRGDAQTMESIARSCQRGWDDRIAELNQRLDALQESEEEEEA